MRTIKLLLTWFEIDEHSEASAANRLGLLSRMIFALLLLISCLSSVAGLWIAWVVGGMFWVVYLNTLPAVMFSSLLIARYAASVHYIPGWPLRRDFLGLRRAAMAGDETLAPLAANQPQGTPPMGPERTAPETVGPLVRLNSTIERAAWLVPFAYGLSLWPGITMLAVYFFVLPDAATSGSLSTLGAWRSLGLLLSSGAFGLASLMQLAVGLLGLWRTLRFPADLGIRVDDQGIGWRRRPWDRRLILRQWSDARAFYMMSYKGGRHWTTRTVYALDFGTVILAWEVVAISNRYASAKAQARERSAREVSQRLCDEIVRHTELPLRDVTALALRIDAMNGAATQEPETNPLASALLAYTGSQASQLPVADLAPRSKTAWAWRLGQVVILVVYGVLTVVAAIGVYQQLSQL